jgi:hypothetical protein
MFLGVLMQILNNSKPKRKQVFIDSIKTLYCVFKDSLSRGHGNDS